MKLRKIRWKIALPMMLLALATGCGEGQGSTPDSSNANQSVASSSATSSEPASEEPKSEIDLLLDIDDTEKRFTEAEKLIVSRLSNFEENLDENLKLLQITAECKVESNYGPFLSDNEFNDIKKKVLDKVEKYNGKSAIVYKVSDLYNDGIALSIFDNEDRLTYINNNVYTENGELNWNAEYEMYFPDNATISYRFAQDLYCQYDDEGRMTTITVNLLSGNDMEERVDRAEYDEKGNLTKHYRGDTLVRQFEYNADVSCTNDGSVKYQYRKDGYLSKSTKNSGNEKSVTDFPADSKIKAVFYPREVGNLMNQLGENLMNLGIDGTQLVLQTDLLANPQFGYIDEKDFSKEQNDDSSVSESTKLFPRYSSGRNYCVVGVTKDHGDGFIEYIRYSKNRSKCLPHRRRIVGHCQLFSLLVMILS